ncbi:MAG: D-alanyl-D-alanine carboxypeptidase [Clostridia bacterium]|nr:D-alanyl-D-alanine carboxypeptidase [Clostridia bacterium]
MKKIICFILVCFLVLPTMSVAAVSTSAKAAILINGDTGEVIYEQNADEKLPMASTTKIMTALLLCENGDFEKEITVTAEMLRVEGSSMGLLANDKVTFHDLLYGLLLASGNDAANVVAFALGGTVNGFVGLMNKKAEQLGLNSTHFVTPSGLDADGHYTTARDLSTLARIAMQNKDFALAASCESAVLNYGNPPYRRSLTNHNKLLKTFDGAVGVKTGFTKKSGRCLVSAARRDGKYLIAVTLNDANDWKDHTELLEYGFNEIKLVDISPKKTKYSIPVVNGEQVSLDIKIEPYAVSFFKNNDFSCEVNLPKFLYAPINKGDIIGSVVYKKGETLIDKVDILANKDIDLKKQNMKITEILLENIKHIFLNLWEK